jgi:hypothetical protein
MRTEVLSVFEIVTFENKPSICGNCNLRVEFSDIFLEILMGLTSLQFFQYLIMILLSSVGNAVAQLVEALALQAGSSRVRFPMVSLKFLIDIKLPAALCP